MNSRDWRASARDVEEVQSALGRSERRGEHPTAEEPELDDVTLRLFAHLRQAELSDREVDVLVAELESQPDIAAEDARAEVERLLARRQESSGVPARATGKQKSR